MPSFQIRISNCLMLNVCFKSDLAEKETISEQKREPQFFQFFTLSCRESKKVLRQVKNRIVLFEKIKAECSIQSSSIEDENLLLIQMMMRYAFRGPLLKLRRSPA